FSLISSLFPYTTLFRSVVEQINNEYPDSAVAYKHDVTSEEDWKEVAKKGNEKFGKLNVLINNAGIFEYTPFEELTHEQWNKVLRSEEHTSELQSRFDLV